MGAAETPIKNPPKAEAPKKSLREKMLERRDPKIRENDGVDNSVRLDERTKDPGRWYLWANTRSVAGNTLGDVSYYVNMARSMGLDDTDGYEVEHVRPGGVKAYGAISTDEGEVIENVWGQTLLSCSLEFKQLVDSVGANLQSGQEEADRLESLLISKRNVQDHMRGIGRPGWFTVEADRDHGASHYESRMERG